MNYEYMPQGDLKTITGVVMAMDEDEDGNTVSVAISVSFGIEEVMEAEDLEIEDVTEEFFVVDNEKGRNLLKLVNETVEVTGNIMMDEDGNKWTSVKKFRVVDGE